MPKKVTPAEYQQIEDALLRSRKGATVAELHGALDGSINPRTLRRRLAELVGAGRIDRRGTGRATRYVRQTAAMPIPAAQASTPGEGTADIARYQAPAGVVDLKLTAEAHRIREYVSRPIGARRPCGYERRFLEEYVPNRTTYVPDKLKVHLHRIGQPIMAERAAGTFARDILSRLLVDFSWASSLLEGNTYTRLDIERLIRFGMEAAGKDAKETQMILNHKAAIEWLVEGSDDEVGINRHTFLNLHALLSQNLMADPEASGRLRKRPVEVAGSVYTPIAVPQVVDEHLGQVIQKAALIGDPFEQAFFIMVHIPYLQPFEDVNKRVSRLAANIPLIRGNFCPLSFVDVPERAYIDGYLGVYEMTRMELLRDVFAWAYERSCQKYVVIRDSIAEPDVFRLKYRNALIEVIGGIVRQGPEVTEQAIRDMAHPLVEASDLELFVDLVQEELIRLDEGNIARFRIRLSDYRAWNDARVSEARYG